LRAKGKGDTSAMSSTSLAFASVAEHRAWLATQAPLPKGFRVGATRFQFVPAEVHKPSAMTLTLIVLERPTSAFAMMFTRNALPGAPIIIGRRRLAAESLGAVLINNKISNVCAPAGEAASEALCAGAAGILGLSPTQILPCSTGVIGWGLPVEAMLGALPQAAASLQDASILPAADGIVTTDLYAKIRRRTVGAGSIVGIAKGAGMIEPNLATMLVYLLTDLDVPREALRAELAHAVANSFNRMSIDSDTSTSDTVVALSSGAVPCTSLDTFRCALTGVCADLAEDVVRNGEGVHHVMRVAVAGAPDPELAAAVGKAIVNSPLFQCAVCGNDANVGRLVMAIGKEVGSRRPGLDLSRLRLTMGGFQLFGDGVFRLDPQVEARLVAHLRDAELYASTPPADGLTFVPGVRFPRHERVVEIGVDLGLGNHSCAILGADRSHEYISENADYRS
jgi:glutamate N-acetyltransferase/amino-acid N-acetyltransferase